MTASRPTTPEREEAETLNAAEILVKMANTPVGTSGLPINEDDIAAVPNPGTLPPVEATSTTSSPLTDTTTPPSVPGEAPVHPIAIPSTSSTLSGSDTSTSIPAAVVAPTPARVVAASMAVQSVAASNVVSGPTANRDGTFHNMIVNEVQSARPLPPISWGPTSQKYGHGAQHDASLSAGSSKSKAGNGLIRPSGQSTKSVIYTTTDERHFANLSVKPSTAANPSAHFDKIGSHSLNTPTAHQSNSGAVSYSVINGRPCLGPVTQVKDNAGKSQATPGSVNGRINPGKTGRNGVPRVQTPFSSQRPATQTTFNPFSLPSPGQPMPFWYPATLTQRSSASPYGSQIAATPSRSSPIQGQQDMGSSRTLLPSTPSKSASATSNGTRPRTELPSAPLKNTSIPPSNGTPRTLLPARSSSGSVTSDGSQRSEVFRLMDERMSDIKFSGSAVTTDDLVRLEHMERALLSDFYILHGTFLPHPRYDGQPNEAAFIAGGFRHPRNFYDFEDRMKNLKKKVVKRLEKQAASEHGTQKDWSKQLAEEHETLSILYDELVHCKKCLTGLRKYLERENKVGEFYEYKLKVQYTEIGNQDIPPGYRRSTAAKKKKAAPATNTKTTSGKKRQNFILIDSDNSSEQGSTPTASKPPRKKAKTQPTQSGQISSTTQFRATSQPTNGTGMRQQPRGPAQAMNGSGMQQSPRGPPPASPAVRPRTVADIDRDIAVRAVEVEKLQQEMTRLRWEKLMLEDCGQNGGA